VKAVWRGGEEKDIAVRLSNGIVSIKGEKKQDREEKTENDYLAERSDGAFEPSLQLPDSVDET
jgi:HSP20 family protein